MTPEQKQMLQHEEFVAAIERIRSVDKEKKSMLLEILNSSATITLVTVILGGIIGKIIVGSYQDKQKQNAVSQEQYQVFLGKQRDVVDHAAELIGAGQFDSAQMMSLAQPGFNTRNEHGLIPANIQKKRDDIVAGHDSFSEKWGTESFKSALLLDYYFLSQKAVPDTWRIVVDKLNTLEDCADATYEKAHQHGKILGPNDKPCADERTSLQKALDDFSQSLSAARSYSWQNFSVANSPKHLRLAV